MADQRQFGYIPDPNFTQRFQQALAGDSELQQLLAIEKSAILSTPPAGGWLNFGATLLSGMARVSEGAERAGPLLARTYLQSGGNLANARRIVQLGIQAYVQKKLEKVDLPGPIDAWIRTTVYEMVIKFAGEGFDEAVRP